MGIKAVLSNNRRKTTKAYARYIGQRRIVLKMYAVVNGARNLVWQAQTYHWRMFWHEGQNEHSDYTTSFTVPEGVTSIDICCVGGKGGDGVTLEIARKSSPYFRHAETDFAGGGYGYINTVREVAVTPGETLTIICGRHGNDMVKSTKVVDSGMGEYNNDTIVSTPTDGGASSVKRGSSTILASANGGGRADYGEGNTRYFYVSGSSTWHHSVPDNLPIAGSGSIGGLVPIYAQSETYYISTFEQTNGVFFAATAAANEPNGSKVTQAYTESLYNGSTTRTDLADSVFASINSNGQADLRLFGDDAIDVGYSFIEDCGCVCIRWRQ